jgi:hypothetical protein
MHYTVFEINKGHELVATIHLVRNVHILMVSARVCDGMDGRFIVQGTDYSVCRAESYSQFEVKIMCQDIGPK